MRKEVILAVIIGVLLGGIILYGISLANSSSKLNPNNNEPQNSPSPSLTPTPKSENQISIVIPQNNSVVTEDKITLKGTAKPNSNLAIISESDDILTLSDKNGNFSTEINLISGENSITITSVDDKQTTASASIIIIRTNNLPE